MASGRVAGRLEGPESNPPELHDVAVAQRREIVVGLRPRAEMDASADPVAQFQMCRRRSPRGSESG